MIKGQATDAAHRPLANCCKNGRIRFIKIVMIRVVFLQMDIKEFNILESISAQNARNSGSWKHMVTSYMQRKHIIRLEVKTTKIAAIAIGQRLYIGIVWRKKHFWVIGFGVCIE